jgi:thiol-disulfide isomerase/thioredoxin
MAPVFLVASFMLSGVFILAGIFKVADLGGFRRALMDDFGMPPLIGRSLSMIVPVVEVAVGRALLASRTRRLASGAALGVLFVFSLAIAYWLVKGRKGECRCFGRHSKGIGGRTLIRNAVLALAAALVFLGSQTSTRSLWRVQLDFTSPLIISSAIAGTLALVLIWVLLGLVGQNGRLLLRIEELERTQYGSAPESLGTWPGGIDGLVGSAVPRLGGRDRDGRVVTLEMLAKSGRATLLVFADPDCHYCLELSPELSDWQESYGEALTVAVVTRLANRDDPTWLPEIATVIYEVEDEITQAYGIHSTPAALVIDSSGYVRTRPVFGRDAIRSLMKGVVSEISGRLLTKPSIRPLGGGRHQSHLKASVESRSVGSPRLAEGGGLETR